MTVERYHFIGIGGIGMSALARLLLDKKKIVSGSDIEKNDNILDLRRRGAFVCIGHSAKFINPGTTVIYNSRISQSNPEILAASALKCRIMHRSHLLSELMEGTQSLAVCGTHGKTTTAGLLASVLMQGGKDPTFAIGGMLSETNGRLGQGEFFIVEADESDGSFLNYSAQGAILTNIEPEHLEYCKSEDALLQLFQKFLEKIKNQELVFYCGDCPRLSSMCRGRHASYGFTQGNQAFLTRFRQDGWRLFFDLDFEGKHYPSIELPLVGRHNALNASAAFALGLRLNIPEEAIRKGLQTFPGIARRCQKKAERKGVLFLDDYAHHPTEIHETLRAVKEAVKERRLIAIFQPHRFTRARDLLGGFGAAFSWADQVYVTDIYPSGEKPIEGIDTLRLVSEIKKNTRVPVSFLSKKGLGSISFYPHDVVITLGAGNIGQWHDGALTGCRINKYRIGLIFGGVSCEHEISLRSSRFVARSLSAELYDITFFGISRKGKWVSGEEAKMILEQKETVPDETGDSLLHPSLAAQIEACDLFLPVLHGTNGEDGTVQGFFEMLGKPYFGPRYDSAAISMDKVISKQLVAAAGVPTPAYMSISSVEWQKDSLTFLEKAAGLRFPVFVKPVRLGSSVGIAKVKDPSQLAQAIRNAFHFDHEVLIEEGIENARELEFAVMGDHDGFGIAVPAPGEKCAQGAFVDYEKKYGADSIPTSVFAGLSEELLYRGKECALRAYQAVKGSGMMRVDFLLDPMGTFWFFELNAIPGMQELSLFPKIWKREKVDAQELLNRLIILALHRHRLQQRLTRISHQTCDNSHTLQPHLVSQQGVDRVV